jgi:hypothetical protein
VGIVRRIALLVIVAVAAFVFLWGRAERDRKRSSAALEQARATLDSARAVRARAKAGSGVFLSSDEIAALRRAGLTDPVNQLRSDLEAHGSLIPVKGVLGGTMGFYDRDGVVLLPGGYVYAPGEDGHNLVHAVLRYEVEPGGKIRWTLVDAKPD